MEPTVIESTDSSSKEFMSSLVNKSTGKIANGHDAMISWVEWLAERAEKMVNFREAHFSFFRKRGGFWILLD